MSEHKGIWRTSCCGEKDYAAQKRIDDLENALAVAVKKERWRIIHMLHRWSESSWRNGAEREGRAFTVFAKELEAAP